MPLTVSCAIFRLSRVTAAYAPMPDAVRRARALVVGACRGWNLFAPVASIAELVVSELVGNSVRHAGTRIDVTVTRSPGRLTIAVRDYMSAPVRHTGPGDDAAAGGRGLLIVDAVATRWGCTPVTTSTGIGTGKVTWATLAA